MWSCPRTWAWSCPRAIPARCWRWPALWVTNARLYADRKNSGPSPWEMLRGWGFDYVTLLTWHKLGAPGMGWYFRGDTEHVLFGIRGVAPIAPGLRVSNHFAAPRTEHSS